MGDVTTLTAADGHRLSAYLARPEADPKGGLVMIQEVFGVTEQMKRCADRYAEAGYFVVLPAMFDRIERDLVATYTEPQKGGQASRALSDEQIFADIAAAGVAAGEAGKTAIIGYCWGGTVAYMGSSTGDFDCAVSYYGGGIVRLSDSIRPKVPVIYHYGADDSFIPMETINKIREWDPDGIFHIYEGAGHGFNCDDRDSYVPEASQLSEQRSLEFLAANL